ncbi:MAG: undecaprenyl-diphosphate phosphatase [Alphaproteobacteria bacterium]|nr:undecaprenyl-diphosphate phosphatase [Alphaproteobacteria bacterium]
MHVFWLALIQGITEFLPVSSSGHLILFSKYTGFSDQGQAIDIALHIGSLMAVVLYFWTPVKEMVLALLKNKFMPKFHVDSVRLAYYLVFATMPAIIIGGLLSYWGMEWVRSAKLIGWMLILYGIILWFADTKFKTEKKLNEMHAYEAVIIGFAQCLAFIPGTSRSGVTITAGRLMGFNRSEIAKFSMLLSVPSILAAGVVAAYTLFSGFETTRIAMAGQAVCWSFIFSFMAIWFMMKWLQTKTFLPFVIYRIILGMILLADVYGMI